MWTSRFLRMAVRVQGEQLHAATFNVHSHDIASCRHLSISYASLFRWRNHDHDPSDLCIYSKKKYWCVHMCTKSNTDMMPPRLYAFRREEKRDFFHALMNASRQIPGCAFSMYFFIPYIDIKIFSAIARTRGQPRCERPRIRWQRHFQG